MPLDTNPVAGARFDGWLLGLMLVVAPLASTPAAGT